MNGQEGETNSYSLSTRQVTVAVDGMLAIRLQAQGQAAGRPAGRLLCPITDN